MPAISTVTVTGDDEIDAVLSGVKWATTELNFSFPTATSQYGTYPTGETKRGFEALSELQQNAVRAILDAYEAVSNLNFTEVAGGGGDLRYAMSDAPSTAWAYYPSEAATGGDSWYNNRTRNYDNPVMGNYAYTTFIHETGHALGLKHPHTASGAFPAMPSETDSVEFSVMSYRSYIGAPLTGYTIQSGSYPQSLMMLDIAGIQEMYGADYTTNAGDTIYRWSNTTGQMLINGAGQATPLQNKIFMTVWDGGGVDTYDLSNYAGNLTVNLGPGEWSTFSLNQLADLDAFNSGTHLARGNVANALLFEGNTASLIENVVGGSGNDNITGNDGANALKGGGGNDRIDGGLGSDTAIFTGALADYELTDNGEDGYVVADLRGGPNDGTDTLFGIQTLQFSDTILAINQTDTPPPPPPPPENEAPVAVANTYKVNAGQTLNVSAGSGVLANDSDPDGDALTAILSDNVDNGNLTLNANGSLTYTPNAGFVGTDTFSYQAFDGADLSNTVTVSITVAVKKGGPKNNGQNNAEDGPDELPVALASGGHFAPHGVPLDFLPDPMMHRFDAMVGREWWG